MPLVHIKSRESGHIVGLFHITETVDDLFNRLELSQRELEIYSSYTHEEKKREWCAARLLVREICDSVNIPYRGMFKNSNGKPCLIGSNAEISISHSFPYVAVILHLKLPVGIDLEQVKPKLAKIAPRFLSAEELSTTSNSLQKTCIYWCAKEALYKIYSRQGLIFKDDLLIIPDAEYPWQTLTGVIKKGKEVSYKLNVEIHKEFILVYNV